MNNIIKEILRDADIVTLTNLFDVEDVDAKLKEIEKINSVKLSTYEKKYYNKKRNEFLNN